MVGLNEILKGNEGFALESVVFVDRLKVKQLFVGLSEERQVDELTPVLSIVGLLVLIEVLDALGLSHLSALVVYYLELGSLLFFVENFFPVLRKLSRVLEAQVEIRLAN